MNAAMTTMAAMNAMERLARTSRATIPLLAGTISVAASAIAASANAAPAHVPPHGAIVFPAPQVISTQLAEVRRGAVAGRDFLSLRVERPVGPPACRGHVLRVDTDELGDAVQRERIEAVALSAVLEEESVVVTVPLDAARCVGGKPVFTDVRPLPFSS